MTYPADLRRFIVLSGQQEWGVLTAKQLIDAIPENRVLYFSQKKTPDFKNATHFVDQVLGREHSVVIFDAFSGFNPDSFAAIAGTITAGGALILLCPQLSNWHQCNDPFSQRIISWPFTHKDHSGRFIKRFVNQLTDTSFIEIISAESTFVKPLLPPIKMLSIDPFITDDQQHVINSLFQLMESKEPYPLVLDADRGRGKSAALGIAAAQLMDRKNIHIVITAPTLKTSDIVFKHAKQELNNTSITITSTGKLHTEHSSLNFIAPDVCCQEHPSADLLLVDEAASLPTSILAKLLKQYPRIIFSTTTHGYEGTGRGFALRFSQHLDTHTPHWQKINLQTAIRYKANDPLESFIFNSLLLNTKPINDQQITSLQLSHTTLHKLDRDNLLNNENLLQQAFSLLILAHYQTRPSDLYHLLDGVNISIYVMKYKGKVVSVALTVKEGGFDTALAHDIYYGNRRPQGNLVPQSLAFHAGLAEAPLLTTERIMRIVVHPVVQKRGIASKLLSHIEEQTKHCDYLSSSFAATTDMVLFWRRRGFKPVHMGLRRDSSSGCHSLIVIKPISIKGIKLVKLAQQQFSFHLPILLEEPLRDLESSIITALQTTKVKQSQQLSAIDIMDLKSFAYGHRGYEYCLYAIQKLTLSHSIQTQLIPTLKLRERQLLQYRVIDKHPVDYVVNQLKLTGKKELTQLLRFIIQQLISYFELQRVNKNR